MQFGINQKLKSKWREQCPGPHSPFSLKHTIKTNFDNKMENLRCSLRDFSRYDTEPHVTGKADIKFINGVDGSDCALSSPCSCG